MALKKRQAPQISTGAIETCWWDDDAINHEASDLHKWATSGTMDGIICIGEQKPARIKYRRLTEPELDVIPADISDESLLARFYAAAAIGLVSVEGEKLDRERRANAVRITDECIARLSDYHATIPFTAVLREYVKTMGIEVPAAGDDTIVSVSLPAWVGVHVLAATFRARRGVA